MDSLSRPRLLDFLGRISHELRTPLNSLLILSRRLAENDERTLTPAQVEYARAIQQSGSDMMDLIDEILDLARAGSETLAIEKCWVEISDLVGRIAGTFRQVAEEKGLELTTRVGPAVPSAIETDPARLLQVLRNLIANAIAFTDAGEVSLTIDLEAGDRIVFNVRDQGVGIPKDEQPHVFDPYRSRRRRGSPEGAGLGLSISKRLVELLGGSLTFESVVGRGSDFRLEVPRRLGVETPVPARRIPSEPKRRILLVIHGNPLLSEPLERAARANDVELVLAGSGERGVRMARRLSPTAIIVDLAFPALDRWILLDVLKRDPFTRQIPVLALCGGKEARRARRMGAFVHAPSPRSDDEVALAVTAALRFSAASQRTVLVLGEHSLDWNGLEIARASNGREALAAIAAERPDCLVMPPALPDMSATELLDRLHRAGASRPIPSIVYAAADPVYDMGALASLADIVIEDGELAPSLLTEAIARFLHLPDHSLPQDRLAHLGRVRTWEPVLRGRRVLIVDDDVYTIFALTSVFERLSIEVSFCESGREAMERLAVGSFDALLVDIVMPDMDGLDTIKKIRRDPTHASLPILAVTAKTMPDDRQACLSAGADEYIPKPVDVDWLLAHLRSRLSAAQHV